MALRDRYRKEHGLMSRSIASVEVAKTTAIISLAFDFFLELDSYYRGK